MRLFPVLPQLWACFLVLWSSGSEMCPYSADIGAIDSDVCGDGSSPGDLSPQIWSVPDYNVLEDAMNEEYFLCVLHPTNVLNCSWWFNTLHDDARLILSISICEAEKVVHSSNHSSEEPVGWMSLTLCEHKGLKVVLHFNFTLHGIWTLYSYTYNMQMLEVLSPPQNVSASFKDGGLLVTWSLPHSREGSHSHCFEYQLDLGDQESPKNLVNLQSYEEPNADQSRSYRVKIRTRQTIFCQQNSQWSDWSPTVKVHQADQLNVLVIVSICLGIPMILLALALFVRYQRVSELLFPPIPRPPEKFKCFLEKNDKFDRPYPVPSAEPLEEITEVEDAEQNPAKTL